MKRFATLLLALMMALTMIPALAEEEPITITVSGPDSVNSQWGDTLAVKYLEELTNTKWDITLYPSDIWKTKMTLLITSDELPDVCFKASMDKAEMNLYGEEGYFLDLTQYLDIMPNFKATLEKYPEYKAYHSTEEGAIYSLSLVSPFASMRALDQVYINREWLKNVNMEIPQTVEDLYDVLKAFKEQDANGNGDPNDEIPLSFETSAGQRAMHLLQAGFGIYSTAFDVMLGVDEDGKVFLHETTENFKNYLKFMNKLYTEKLLDETTFIQTESERREKVINNKVGMFADWSGLNGSTCGINGLAAFETWHWMQGLGSENTPIAFTGWPIVTDNANILVSANTKHPEAVCKVIDALYTDEYNLVYQCGYEGENFEYVTTATGFRVPAIMKSAWEGKYDSEGAYRDQVLNVTQLCAVPYTMYYPVVENATTEELELMKQDEILAVTAYRVERARTGFLAEPYPIFSYTNDENEVRGRYRGDLSAYLQTMRVAFITGEADIEADWETYQATMLAMGLNELLAAEQTAYDRYAVNLK